MFLAKQISLDIKHTIHISIVGYDLMLLIAILFKQNISDDAFSSYIGHCLSVPHFNEHTNILMTILTVFMTKILSND